MQARKRLSFVAAPLSRTIVYFSLSYVVFNNTVAEFGWRRAEDSTPYFEVRGEGSDKGEAHKGEPTKVEGRAAESANNLSFIALFRPWDSVGGF